MNSGHRLDKKEAVRRVRDTFSEVASLLNCTELKLASRMARPAFIKLLGRYSSYLVRNSALVHRCSVAVMHPAIHLVLTLRILAAGSFLDQMMCWNVCRSTVYMAFTETVRAVESEILMPDIPHESESTLRDLCNVFLCFGEQPSPLYGCMRALDGIAIAIRKLPYECVPRNFILGRRRMLYKYMPLLIANSDSCTCRAGAL